MEDILVPLGFFAVIPLIVWAVSHYRTKSRAIMASAIEKLSQNGQQIDADLIEKLGTPQKSPHADLRNGLIGLALGSGLTIMGFAIPEDEAASIMAGVGSIPILIGLALIAFWVFTERKRG